MHRPFETQVLPDSRIAKLLADADFADAWAIESTQVNLSALGHFLTTAAKTPRWIDLCMRLRNRVAKKLGLKHLGVLSDVQAAQNESMYKVGDRVGIFSLLENPPLEVLLGDQDKHLTVTLSVHLSQSPTTAGGQLVTVSTVVKTHQLLGRLYMLPVKPMHRIIVPASLRTLNQGPTA